MGLRPLLATLLVAPAAAQLPVAELTAPVPGPAGTFGRALALAAGPGAGRVLVGSPFEDQGGAAYLFDALDGTLLRVLAPAELVPGDLFGRALDLDGPYAIVGAGRDELGTNAGAAYVFDLLGGGERKLLASDGATNDLFGNTLAAHGGRVIVGAFGEDDGGTDAGAAYVFDLASGAELLKLTASDAAAGDRFGIAVAIHGDLALVGAFADHYGENSGAVYVFDLVTGQELADLTSVVTGPGALFGSALALDDTRAVVGAVGSDKLAEGGGLAHVFDLASGAELFFLWPADLQEDDGFGGSVALAGERLLVGARGEDSAERGAGAVYVFDRDGAQLSKIVLEGADRDEFLGWGVALAGARAALAAPFRDGAAEDGGAVTLFCMGEPLGASYCGPAPKNSTGQSAAIAAFGSLDLTCDYLELEARDLPAGQPGCFLASETASFVPFVGGSQGHLCLGGTIGRFRAQAGFADAAGRLAIGVDLAGLPPPLPPGVQPGETWHFQAWYRDHNPGPTSNLTDGVAVTW